MVVRINPSILSADFAALAHDIARIPGADLVHVDVMDNHFVPNLTFGLPMLERLRQVTDLPLDAHLMMDDPDRFAPQFAEAGAAVVTFHAEAARDAVGTARAVRRAGARAGLALKPGTPAAPWLDRLDEFDEILVMTVEPGFGGQSFMPEMMAKVAEVRRAVGGRDVWIQVDGGIGESTIRVAADAGADVFVAGSAVFGADDPDAAIAALRALAAGDRPIG